MHPLIIKMEGGLGNQLLQYLFGISLARKYKKNIYFDISEYIEGRGIRKLALLELSLPGNYISLKKNFNASTNTVKVKNIRVHRGSVTLSDRLRLLRSLPVAHEKQNGTIDDFSHINPGYLIGYWVSYFYWHQPKELTHEVNQLFDSIEAKRKGIDLGVSIDSSDGWAAVHVRRGDYLRQEHINWYGLCSAAFYLAAIKAICKDKILLFSDDPTSIKSNFSHFTEVINISELSGNEIDEFLMMRRCKNIVISNSTYSYAAALFSSFTFPDHRIVAPEPWFQWSNLSPPVLESWTTLGRRTGGDLDTIKKRTSDLTHVCAVLQDFDSQDEIRRCLKMLSNQPVLVKTVIICTNCIAPKSLADSLPADFKPDLAVIRLEDQGSSLRKTCAAFESEYFVVLVGAQDWSETKLSNDLLLATETNSDMVVSPFHIKTSGSQASLTRLSPPFSIENKDDLRRSAVLTVMAHHGTVLVRTAAFDAMMEDPITELAMCSDRLTIQYQDPTEYPTGFWSETSTKKRNAELLERHSRVVSQSRDPEKAEKIFNDVWEVNSHLNNLYSIHR
jgi:hypothetical protein